MDIGGNLKTGAARLGTPGCPIGRGRIDYAAIQQLLSETGYGGYITIEQERDPRNSGGVLADLAASRDFLRRSGF